MIVAALIGTSLVVSALFVFGRYLYSIIEKEKQIQKSFFNTALTFEEFEMNYALPFTERGENNV